MRKIVNFCSDLDFEPSSSLVKTLTYVSCREGFRWLCCWGHFTELCWGNLSLVFTSDFIWVNCQKPTLRTYFGKLPLHTPHNKGLVGALPKCSFFPTLATCWCQPVQLTLGKTEFNTSPLKLGRNPKKKRLVFQPSFFRGIYLKNQGCRLLDDRVICWTCKVNIQTIWELFCHKICSSCSAESNIQRQNDWSYQSGVITGFKLIKTRIRCPKHRRSISFQHQTEWRKKQNKCSCKWCSLFKVRLIQISLIQLIPFTEFTYNLLEARSTSIATP